MKIFVTLFVATTMLSSANAAEKESPVYQFDKPIRLTADDEVISVEAPGYACPTMADIDGDGREDLIVGQFHRGKMQFFRNIAKAGEPPKFAAGEWLKSEGEPLEVPGVW